jgi:proteasome lid subunit RPN8/RPN11
MELKLSEAHYNQICTHLENAFPNEGGGFLVGELNGDKRTVTEVHPVQNVFETEEQFHRFLAEDGAYQRIEDEADARGLTLLGYFHSHPNHPAVPSEFDRTHALPFFAYLIISVRNGQRAEGRAWELAADRSTFHEAKLHIHSIISTQEE